MPWVLQIAGKGRFVSADTMKTECVEFVRQTSRAPQTSEWRPGLRVMDARPGQIPPGTAIATFVDGEYPTDALGRHAAIYLSHDQFAITVLDQWVPKTGGRGEVKQRPIRFKVPGGTRRSNDGSCFYVIE
jgi:hypothetical protein